MKNTTPSSLTKIFLIEGFPHTLRIQDKILEYSEIHPSAISA
jgi:hypothetical protein